MLDWKSSIRSEGLNRGSLPVVVFCDRSYRPVLENWLTFIQKLAVRDIVVFALDDETAALARRFPTRTVECEAVTDDRALWSFRVEVFEFLTQEGISFIHSDADAIWLRDPRPEYFDAYPQADLIASQGTRLPADVCSVWGFVICCGLFLLRSSPATVQLMADVREEVPRCRDDQVALNRVLCRRTVDWKIEVHGKINTGRGTFVHSRNIAIGSAGAISMALLPFNRFPRLPELGEDPYVVHPLTGITAEDKIEELARLGLWQSPST